MDDTITLAAEDRIAFPSPVCIRLADSTKRPVKSVKGACEVLIDWPHARRGPVYQETMEVLQAALAGSKSADEAHTAFRAFATHAGVLEE